MKRISFLSLLIFLNNTTLCGMDHIIDQVDQLIAQYDPYFTPKLTNKFSSFLEQDDLSHLTADNSPLLDIDLYRKFPETLPLLLAKRANPNIIDQNKCTPLGLAIHAITQEHFPDTAPNAAIALLNAGADPNKKHKATCYYMVKEPPLLTAIHFGKEKIVQALFEHGAKLDHNALFVTLHRGLLSIPIRDRSAKVAILLRSGANPLSSVNGQDILFFMKKEYTTYFPLGGSDNDYKKIGRAFIWYAQTKKVLGGTFFPMRKKLPKELISLILRFVDYDLEENSESTT